MNKKFILAGVICASILVTYMVHHPYDTQAQSGGITGVSGSPGAQQECSSCHFVSNRVSNPALQSDIPAEGYVPEQVYNFTLHIRSQKVHAGFNIKPENNQSEAVGTLIRTDSINSNISFSADEITHNNNIVHGGSKYVHFKWVAPSKGSGDVTFYAALGTGVVADTNGLFMDSLNLFHVSYKEAVVSHIEDQTDSDAKLSVTPTIANEFVTIVYITIKGIQTSLVLQNEDGKIVNDLSTAYTTAMGGSSVKNIDVSNLPNGIYFVKLQNGPSTSMKRVIISR